MFIGQYDPSEQTQLRVMECDCGGGWVGDYNGHMFQCLDCDGTGEIDVKFSLVTMEDLDELEGDENAIKALLEFAELTADQEPASEY